mgnify:CR=1 FL=1
MTSLLVLDHVEAGLAAAFAAGSPLALVEREVAADDGSVHPSVRVPDAVEAMGTLASWVVRQLRQDNGLKVVAVTGSVGKTTTKDLLRAIFSEMGPTVAPQGSYNSEVGVPLTVCRVTPRTEHLVVEMGARGRGHIAYLTEIAPPRIGVVLNVGNAHVGEFGSLDAVAEATGLPREELEAAAQDPTRYGVPGEAGTLEGWLDAGEYRLPVDATAGQVLDALVRPTLAELDALDVRDPAEQQRVLTIASILEAEALPQDYRQVAGAIENRLAPDNTETHGLLQIDATVTYGLGVRSLSFTSGQRQDASNPYNTYVHPGLPPGPIGMPSDAAVEAALDPAETDAYYWVTTDIGTGHTEFSRTYEEHQQHVRTLQRYCASNPGVC